VALSQDNNASAEEPNGRPATGSRSC